ncbi:unconventional prefoldin RPB5 interactor-like [Haliotis rufescens]|uniref:unconventional prefoldin RPB5 interactor-like n=1 Tax=Haliotis rufescens TaxID=6454 RepID=UPI00201EC9DF|nr:unconventional prefoldin RPB5 interactor-like [Haliotis rufescens]XP_048253612.1 unconventional prefoldin RPB5 interactor-like [Haliotis rufescens]
MEATHLARLRQEQDKAIEETENKIAQWQQYQSDYEALHRRLRTLPDKVEHDVMVPFGSLAFMPGRLVHTNEVMVLLGDNWFVERSAKQAAEIVSRRIKAVEENLEKLREEKRLLTPRQVFTQELEDMAQGSSDIKEIVEKYDSDTEKEWRVQHKKNVRVYREKLKKDKSTPKPEKKDEPVSDEALWARLDELEKLEAEQHEFDKMDNDVEEAGVTTKGRQPSPPPAEQQRRVSWADEARHDGSDTESDEEEEEESTSASDYDTDTEEEMARKQMSRITFTHSSPQKSSSEDRNTSNTEDSGEVPEIQSPSDIYKQFLETPQPKSILKKKKTKDRTMQERKAAELEREKAKAKAAEDLKNAFTGTVVENPTRGAGTAETCTAPPTRPVSKFRAQRQQQGGAKR